MRWQWCVLVFDQVVDGYGNIAGLLSIARCLYDAIHRLEKKAIKAEEKAAAGGDTADIAASFLKVCRCPKWTLPLSISKSHLPALQTCGIDEWDGKKASIAVMLPQDLELWC